MKIKDDMLFNIAADPSEKNNVKEHHQKVFQDLNDVVSQFDSIESKTKVPPYLQGIKGFKAPKEWTIAK